MKRLQAIVLITIALLILVSLALAEGNELELPWHRIAGGGGTSTDDARFSLVGLIGQPEAGAVSQGSSFVLSGGYWGGDRPVAASYELYLPVLLRPG